QSSERALASVTLVSGARVTPRFVSACASLWRSGTEVLQQSLQSSTTLLHPHLLLMGCSSSSAQTVAEENRPGVKEKEVTEDIGTRGSHFSHDETTDANPVLDQNQLPLLEPPPDCQLDCSVLLGPAPVGSVQVKLNSDKLVQQEQIQADVSIAEKITASDWDLDSDESAEAHKLARDHTDPPEVESTAEPELDSDILPAEPEKPSDHIITEPEPLNVAEPKLELDQNLSPDQGLCPEPTEEKTGPSTEPLTIKEPDPALPHTAEELDSTSEPKGEVPGSVSDSTGQEEPGPASEPSSTPETNGEPSGSVPELTAEEPSLEPTVNQVGPAPEAIEGELHPTSKIISDISNLAPEISHHEWNIVQNAPSTGPPPEPDVMESGPVLEPNPEQASVELRSTSEPVPEHSSSEITMGAETYGAVSAPDPKTSTEPPLEPKLISEPAPEQPALGSESSLVKINQEPAVVDTSTDPLLSEFKENLISTEVGPEEIKPPEASD
ncbi:hypothetical protein DNTS_006034, partial [Danionella cerebrum]